MKPSTPPTPGAVDEQAVAERLAAVRDAVANQRLEGLEPDPAAIAALERAARGELAFDDALAAYLARVTRGGGGDEVRP